MMDDPERAVREPACSIVVEGIDVADAATGASCLPVCGNLLDDYIETYTFAEDEK